MNQVDKTNKSAGPGGNVMFTSPLGFKIVFPQNKHKHKDVYQKPTKANIFRASIVKFPDDREMAIRSASAELRVRGIAVNQNDLNSYYWNAREEMKKKLLHPIAS